MPDPRRAGYDDLDTFMAEQMRDPVWAAEYASTALIASVSCCSVQCGREVSRGRLCQYHQGMEDGIDMVLVALFGDDVSCTFDPARLASLGPDRLEGP